MSFKITILVGLPGSGKTTFGKDHDCFIDDISIVGLNELRKAIDNKKEHILISDVFLCRSVARELACRWFDEHAKGYELEWLYFENSPDKCKANVKKRNDGRLVNDLIDSLSLEYVIPDGSQVLFVP
jgi:adenylate kinase family enzyme